MSSIRRGNNYKSYKEVSPNGRKFPSQEALRINSILRGVNKKEKSKCRNILFQFQNTKRKILKNFWGHGDNSLTTRNSNNPGNSGSLKAMTQGLRNYSKDDNL